MVDTVDDRTFETAVIGSEHPVLVEFGADWCPPCRMIAPILDEIAAARSDFRVVSIDVDANPETRARYRVMSLPTLLLFVNGSPVRQVIGFTSKGRLLELVDEALDAQRSSDSDSRFRIPNGPSPAVSLERQVARRMSAAALARQNA